MSEYVVERSTVIDAPPATVFEHVGTLERMNTWSPWSDLDPNMTTTYEGEQGAIGSSYHWKGNRKVGEGRMVLTERDAPNGVGIDLSFLKPFKAENATEVLVEPSGAGSVVTWRITGKETLMVKVMALVGKSMDKMIGKDFEKGLAKLKQVSET